MKKRWFLFALFTVLCVLGCTKISDYYEDYRDLYDNLDISIVKSGISWKYYEYANNYSDGATAQTASLAIKIKNNGSYLDDATASLSTNHKDVTLRDSSSHSFVLYSGGDYIIEFENSDTGYYYTFSVPLNFSEDEKIPFTITFTDSHGNTQKRKIEVALSDEIDLETEYNSISSGTLINLYAGTNYKLYEYYKESGNTILNSTYATLNGEADAGENLYLDIKLQNNGTGTVKVITVSLSTSSPYVTINRGVSSTIESLAAGASRTLTNAYGYFRDTSGDLKDRAFSFSISSDCPSGEPLLFTLTFTDSSGNEYIDYLNLQVQ